jgi:hypothetical protein
MKDVPPYRVLETLLSRKPRASSLEVAVLSISAILGVSLLAWWNGTELLPTLAATSQGVLQEHEYWRLVTSIAVHAPSTDTFSPTDDINYATATLLMNGKVLFVGDADNAFHTTEAALLYDLSTGRFTVAGSTTIGRDAHSTTLLPDGT